MQQDKNKNKQVRKTKQTEEKEPKKKQRKHIDEETHVCTNKNRIKTQNFKT